LPWVRFDDQFPINRKVARLSDPAFRLHVSAIFWSARNLTDGSVPTEDLPLAAPGSRRLDGLVAELVDRGLWIATPPLGWVINDYLEYQPSRQVVKAMREGKSDGGRKGNHLRWHAGRGIVEDDCPWCVEP
jgi:hypothetical protein